MRSAADIEVDSSGNFYVTSDHQLEKFSNIGLPLGKWGDPDDLRSSAPLVFDVDLNPVFDPDVKHCAGMVDYTTDDVLVLATVEVGAGEGYWNMRLHH